MVEFRIFLFQSSLTPWNLSQPVSFLSERLLVKSIPLSLKKYPLPLPLKKKTKIFDMKQIFESYQNLFCLRSFLNESDWKNTHLPDLGQSKGGIWVEVAWLKIFGAKHKVQLRKDLMAPFRFYAKWKSALHVRPFWSWIDSAVCVIIGGIDHSVTIFCTTPNEQTIFGPDHSLLLIGRVK